MLKRNNKGFMLMETLLVSVFIASTLIFLYIQFQKVRDSYQSSFTYNTVTGTYASSNFLNYLQENGIDNLSKTINSGTVYIDLTTCPGSYLSNTSLCKKLITDLGIKKVIYASSDTTNLITRMNNSTDFSPKFKNFIRNIKVTNRISYRLLFEYTDETYSTVLARSNTVNNSPVVNETPVSVTCYIAPNSLVTFNNDCTLVNMLVNTDVVINSVNPITVNGNFKANKTYRLAVTEGYGKFDYEKGGNLSYNDRKNVFSGSWVKNGLDINFTFTPTADISAVTISTDGTYISASNVTQIRTLINIKVYEVG